MTADWIMYTVLAAIVALFLAAVFFADDIAAFLWQAALTARDAVVRAARLIASRYRPRLLRGAPSDHAPLDPRQQAAWDEIEANFYSSATSERVYPGHRKPPWRRRHLGRVVVIRERGTWWRSLWTG